ncbi:hypothetical protein CEXT_697971 [Caerostris extrusa]|uniref:Uncharacterized protein n=1 Tax=Caerostris extrusa TaxID=172846 RepID=A0AAV4XWV8_CAEEX|nr:hypothetical protein CEXT_697971 [Caerostris extrusa]
MPPRYLLGLTKDQKYTEVYDFAGVDPGYLEILTSNLEFQSEPKYIYAIIPHGMNSSIRDMSIFKSKYKYFNRKFIFPHLSTENLPKINELTNVILSNSSVGTKFLQIKRMLSICVLIFKASGNNPENFD